MSFCNQSLRVSVALWLALLFLSTFVSFSVSFAATPYRGDTEADFTCSTILCRNYRAPSYKDPLVFSLAVARDSHKKLKWIEPMACPIKAPLMVPNTDGFRCRMHPRLHYERAHQGIDIGRDDKNSIPYIHSIMSGTVIHSGPASGFGNQVQVRNNDGTITTYTI